MPYGRLDAGTWLHAAYGQMLPVRDGTRVVSYVCGDELATSPGSTPPATGSPKPPTSRRGHVGAGASYRRLPDD